jgi:creatinine amidohydrolase/Fe(II)-dependent formamide hydrolase-like protein
VAAPATSVAPLWQLEEMTSAELQARIAGGARTGLIPVGGTEQNGAHMVLGKHNVRVRALAGRIAERLGDAIVAPVLAYVPEGAIDPPTQHMRWPGTISVSDAAFEATLEGAARSLRRHGLCHLFFLGDHGGYRASLDRVASRLNREAAAGPGCRVHALPEYYRAAQEDFAQALKARGFGAAEIGSHAGLADTSLALAIDPVLVRAEALASRPRSAAGGGGVIGDPGRASAELGRPGLEHIVEASVAAIRAAVRAGR